MTGRRRRDPVFQDPFNPAPTPDEFGVTVEDVERYFAVEDARPELPDSFRRHAIIFATCVAYLAIFLQRDDGSLLAALSGPALLVGAITGLITIALTVWWCVAMLRLARVKRDAPSQEVVAKVLEFLEAERAYGREATVLRRQIERAADQARRRQEDYWRRLDPYDFEREMERLFASTGYRTRHTGKSGDEGVDLVLERDGAIIVVQCKHVAMPVGPAVARELLGAMVHYGAQQCMLVSTGGFAASVQQFAQGKPMTLIDLPQILDMERGSKYE